MAIGVRTTAATESDANLGTGNKIMRIKII